MRTGLVYSTPYGVTQSSVRLVGNWARLVDAGIGIGEIITTVLQVGVRPAGEVEGSNVQSSFHLHIAHSESLLGPTFRAFGHLASTSMTPLELGWQSQPSYRKVGGSDASKIFNAEAVGAAFSCIIAFWSFF